MGVISLVASDVVQDWNMYIILRLVLPIYCVWQWVQVKQQMMLLILQKQLDMTSYGLC